jgi:hypothetical protein
VAFKEAYHPGLELGWRTLPPKIKENKERRIFDCANHKVRINTGKWAKIPCVRLAGTYVLNLKGINCFI